MKRNWLYIGVIISSIFQFSVEGLWSEIFSKESYAELRPILCSAPELLYNLLSQVAFALVIGFFYLHVPNEKRSLRSGATIGAILGILIGLYQSLEGYGSFNVSASIIGLEIVKTILLGIICGVTISVVELKVNRKNT